MRKLLITLSGAAACCMIVLCSPSFTSYAQTSVQEEESEQETVQITIIPDRSEDTAHLFGIAAAGGLFAAAGGGTYYIHKKKKK